VATDPATGASIVAWIGVEPGGRWSVRAQRIAPGGAVGSPRRVSAAGLPPGHGNVVGVGFNAGLRTFLTAWHGGSTSTEIVVEGRALSADGLARGPVLDLRYVPSPVPLHLQLAMDTRRDRFLFARVDLQDPVTYVVRTAVIGAVNQLYPGPELRRIFSTHSDAISGAEMRLAYVPSRDEFLTVFHVITPRRSGLWAQRLAPSGRRIGDPVLLLADRSRGGTLDLAHEPRDRWTLLTYASPEDSLGRSAVRGLRLGLGGRRLPGPPLSIGGPGPRHRVHSGGLEPRDSGVRGGLGRGAGRRAELRAGRRDPPAAPGPARSSDRAERRPRVVDGGRRRRRRARGRPPGARSRPEPLPGRMAGRRRPRRARGRRARGVRPVRRRRSLPRHRGRVAGPIRRLAAADLIRPAFATALARRLTRADRLAAAGRGRAAERGWNAVIRLVEQAGPNLIDPAAAKRLVALLESPPAPRGKSSKASGRRQR
jgi:hypothetical protein